MWRFDATPRRVPTQKRDASRPSAGDVRHLELSVPASPGAPASARAAIAHWLGAEVSETLFADTLLLVSELVTNSVRHARMTRGAAIWVTVEISDGLVRLQVENPGDAVIAAATPDREHGGGFGLNLVETLAERWGFSHDGTTCVWAELALSPAT